MSAGGCVLCERLAAAQEPLGGWLLRDEQWAAGVMPGAEVPGWVVLQPARHVERVWDLEPQALAGLGPVVARLSEAIAGVCGAARVYLGAFGERIPHWHLIVAPPPADLAAERRGPALLAGFGDLVDRAAAERTAALVRARLDGTGHGGSRDA